ncbi:MAG: helix-turn-helix domain-containing protein, partial [Firmicutes bacterium]|nr:helix-turn-helix domain-containing protein [Bacillota bacterium]
MNNQELTIGQRVRKARKEKGYSQTELANVLGKSLRTIQKYENGEIEISISMINALANALDTTSTYLLGYK